MLSSVHAVSKLVVCHFSFMEKPEHILFAPSLFFVVVAVLPSAVVLICLGMYGYRTGVYGFPPIFELSRELPESRTFSVGINICSWMSVPVFLFVDRVLKLKCRLMKRETLLTVIARYLMDIAGGCSFFSLVCVASVSVIEPKRVHVVASTVFVASLSLFFLLADIIMYILDLRVTFLDIIWDVAGAFFFLISVLFHFVCFEYLGSAVLFLKYLELFRTLPKARVMLTKKPI